MNLATSTRQRLALVGPDIDLEAFAGARRLKGRAERPQSVREFLEGGGQLGDAELFLGAFAQLVLVDLFTLPADLVAERVAEDRRSAEQLLADPAPTSAWIAERNASYGSGSADTHRSHLERFIRLALWSDEAVADPEVAELARCAMPPDVVEEHRRLLELTRRPHPLELGVPATWWACANCGAVFDQGACEAVLIGSRPGFSELDYPIYYCTGCVAVVAAAEEAGVEHVTPHRLRSALLARVPR